LFGKCRGLAFAGSGDKGPYQIGAFKGLYDSLGSEEIKYDVVTGVSVGALNAMLLSQYKKGDEE
jgi:predicted acylesterase/phospholipase RssA